MDFLDDPILKSQFLSPKNTAILTKLLTIDAHILDSTSPSTHSKRGSLKNPRLLINPSSRPKSKNEDDLLDSTEPQQDIPSVPTKSVNFSKQISEIPRSLSKASSFLTNKSFHSRKNSDILSSPASMKKSQAGSPTKSRTEIRRQRTKKDSKTLKDSTPTPNKTNESQSKNQNTFPYGEDTTAKDEDSLTDTETVPLYTTIRRRSCCCADCGDMSKLEKKHMNIAIPCKRVLASKEILRLSFRYSGDWSFFLGSSSNNNGRRPSSEISPMTRRTRFSQDMSPMLNSPASSISSSKRLLNVAVSWDNKAPQSNLSRFAGKKNLTFKSEAERYTKTSLNRIESKVCLEDDAEKEEDPNPLPSAKLLRHVSNRDAILNPKFTFDVNDIDKKASSLAHLNLKEGDKNKPSSRPASKAAGLSSLEFTEPPSLVLGNQSNQALRSNSRPPQIQVTQDPEQLQPSKSKSAYHRPQNSLFTISPRSPPQFGSFDRIRTEISPTIRTPRKAKKLNTNKLQSMNMKIKTQSILDTYLTGVSSMLLSPKLTTPGGNQKIRHHHHRAATAILPQNDKMLPRPQRPKFATSLASSNTFFKGSPSYKNTDMLPNLSPRGMSEDPKYQQTLTLIPQKSSTISQRSTLVLSPDLIRRKDTNEGIATFKLDGETSSPKKKKKVVRLKTKKNTTLLEGLRKMYMSPRNIQSSSVKSREI